MNTFIWVVGVLVIAATTVMLATAAAGLTCELWRIWHTRPAHRATRARRHDSRIQLRRKP